MTMKVPLSWLREYIDINVSPDELAKRLTLAGQEVEHIITIGAEWENIYTGVSARLEQHPNADRLKLATVEYGSGQEHHRRDGRAQHRGRAEGRAWPARLALPRPALDPPKWSSPQARQDPGRPDRRDGHVGGRARPFGGARGHHRARPGTPIGLPAREVLGDTIFEIDVTPNNGRVLSMIGIAREVAAHLRWRSALPARPSGTTEGPARRKPVAGGDR